MIRPSTLIKHSPGRTHGRDRWQDAAVCVNEDPEMFFIAGTGDAWERDDHAIQRAYAKAVCASCPVIAECLADAYESGDKDSIRGGLTPVERDKLRAKAKRKSTSKRTAPAAPVLCEGCDREFSHPSKLRFHMATHKPQCVNGHDTTEPGSRSKSGTCRQCRAESDRRKQRAS